MQGYLAGKPFLVNCPINWFASAALAEVHLGLTRLTHPKSVAAAMRASAVYGVKFDPKQLTIASTIPRGKGMASSTAEMAAAVAASLQPWEPSPDWEALSRLIATVEPTDGVYFPGITSLNHLTGERYQSWSLVPR